MQRYNDGSDATNANAFFFFAGGEPGQSHRSERGSVITVPATYRFCKTACRIQLSSLRPMCYAATGTWNRRSVGVPILNTDQSDLPEVSTVQSYDRILHTAYAYGILDTLL